MGSEFASEFISLYGSQMYGEGVKNSIERGLSGQSLQCREIDQKVGSQIKPWMLRRIAPGLWATRRNSSIACAVIFWAVSSGMMTFSQSVQIRIAIFCVLVNLYQIETSPSVILIRPLSISLRIVLSSVSLDG